MCKVMCVWSGAASDRIISIFLGHRNSPQTVVIVYPGYYLVWVEQHAVSPENINNVSHTQLNPLQIKTDLFSASSVQDWGEHF